MEKLLTLLINNNLLDDVIEMYNAFKYEYLESRYGNEKVLYYTEKYSNKDLKYYQAEKRETFSLNY